MITYRRIQECDNLALAKMIRAVFEEYDAPKQGTVYADPTTDDLYALFQTPKSAFFVAVDNGQAVGCCGVYPTKGLPNGYAELVKFYLSPTVRGQGVGRTLMERSVDAAKALGYTHIYIESLPVFDNAVRIYEKQGFSSLDSPLGESGHTSCNVWMVKEIL